ncbi:MAG: transposase [Limisphaerales bacterium]
MNRPVVTETKPRRRFDRTFKQEAVQNWLNSGKAGHVVAEELGITANCLYNWKKAYAPEALTSKAATAEELTSENAALRRELERVREQRNILKKHWASSPNPRATLRADRHDED